MANVRNDIVTSFELHKARVEEDAAFNRAALKSAGLTTDTSAPAVAVTAAATTAAGPLPPPQTTSADKVLAGELAQLAPGLALDGRSTDFLRTALRIAQNEPGFRAAPLQLEARANQHLASEDAYRSVTIGRSSPTR